LYEAAPLSFIADCSGGIGSDGVNRILDIIPITIHQKTPLFIGSELDIFEIESYNNIQQKEIIKYEN
jgi:fructose-1,6-bisphosphatase I